jgi:precorrin-2 dehydrogenase/sirohydrochlorin ferrochelatase
MRTHPVFLRLEGRRCVVIGGDEAATAKARACERAGAEVTLVASDPGPAALALATAGRVVHLARPYRDGDLAGALLAYAATRDPALIARLVDEARRERVLLNVIDVQDACDFLSPAVVERGDLRIAIATGGASPGLSARLRRDLEGQIGPEYATLVAILGAVRRALAADPARAPGRAEVVAALLDGPLLGLVRGGDRAGIDALLARVVGTGCSLAALGVALAAPEAA